MPYVNRELLRTSLAALHGYSPLLLVSLPCMLANKVPLCKTGYEAQNQGVQFGAAEERKWLDKYFRISGGGDDKPYFMPGSGEWVQTRYADRSLQRRRKDFEGTAFFHPSQKLWAFRPEIAAALTGVLNDAGKIPIVALMVWMWRDRELESLEKGVEIFLSELGLTSDKTGLVGTIYENNVAQKYLDAGLAIENLDPEEIVELVGGNPPPISIPSMSDLVSQLGKSIKDNHLIIPDGLVERILGGWLVQDIVVLVGPTGSGKTTVATEIAKGLRAAFGDERFTEIFLQVTPDYDLAQFLGYENLAGEFTAGQFATEGLFVGGTTDPRLVVLDEWNLAQIDSYFAPILSALETGLPMHLPGRLEESKFSEDSLRELNSAQPEAKRGRWRLPNDTLFLATCNSWLEEPDTRLPISGPVKRRCRVISMPNVLSQILKRDGRQGLIEFCDRLLQREKEIVTARVDGGQGSIFDAHRLDRLDAISELSQLPEEVGEHLITTSRLLLENDQTQNVVTPGILNDLLLACVYAKPGDELLAFGQQISDKLLHQIQGEVAVLGILSASLKNLPSIDEINALIRRMGGLGGDTRITPVV